MEAQQPDRQPPSLDAMDRSCASMDDEITLVAAFVEGKVVINVRDIESYGSEPQLIEDSTNEDIDDDDKGVTQGVEMPSALEPHALYVDAPSAASTKAVPTSTPTMVSYCKYLHYVKISKD